MHARIVLIYDSLTNSVFESQVVKPLLHHKEKLLVIITFEPNIQEPLINHYQEKYRSIKFVIFKRWPFFGTINLYYAAFLVRSFLQDFTTYSLQARGPLAGFIAQQAITKTTSLMIQARGLLAQEYAYQHEHHFTWWYRWRYQVFNNLEKKVYSTLDNNHSIEAVSPALRDYLITTYQTPAEKITVAQFDIPPVYLPAQITAWRHETRQALHIPHDAFVYCYNGSAKPWQMPAESLDFFVDALRKNPKSFLLVLTQDVNLFNNLRQEKNIPEHFCCILTVAHENIYQHLAAADAGLLLRQPHVINWISRPTKVLEYHAVGLQIIHNNTVAWLTQNA